MMVNLNLPDYLTILAALDLATDGEVNSTLRSTRRFEGTSERPLTPFGIVRLAGWLRSEQENSIWAVAHVRPGGETKIYHVRNIDKPSEEAVIKALNLKLRYLDEGEESDYLVISKLDEAQLDYDVSEG
jgi:hypothetical protein